MTQLRLFVLVTVITLLTACRGGTSPEITPAPLPSAPLPDSSSYPAPALPALPTGYPEAAAPTATTPAESGKTVWLLHPWGIQCEGPGPYADLAAAVSALEEAGVDVLEAQNVELMVCQACGCATSEHFRVQVAAEDRPATLALGWQEE